MADTTIKVKPGEHQSLIALLQFGGGVITKLQFETIMVAQGRAGFTVDSHLGLLNEQLLAVFR